jgi:hypothetical protein
MSWPSITDDCTELVNMNSKALAKICADVALVPQSEEHGVNLLDHYLSASTAVTLRRPLGMMADPGSNEDKTDKRLGWHGEQSLESATLIG